MRTNLFLIGLFGLIGAVMIGQVKPGLVEPSTMLLVYLLSGTLIVLPPTHRYLTVR